MNKNKLIPNLLIVIIILIMLISLFIGKPLIFLVLWNLLVAIGLFNPKLLLSNFPTNYKLMFPGVSEELKYKIIRISSGIFLIFGLFVLFMVLTGIAK